MNASQVRRQDVDGVVTLTFTRDEKLNAVTPTMLDALRTAVGDVGDREDLRVLVIRAEGRYFTAGMDISTIDYGPARGDDGSLRGTLLRRNYRRLHLLLDEIEAIEKPVVLVAQGPCLGFGVELASSCDFRLASSAATFALPEVVNLGVLPGSGGISRLTRLIGPHWARWIAMAGQTISAELAMQIGFVHAVHESDDLDSAVSTFTQELVAMSSEAVALAKLTIDAAASVDRTTARDLDRIANSLLIGTDEHHALIRRFVGRSD